MFARRSIFLALSIAATAIASCAQEEHPEPAGLAKTQGATIEGDDASVTPDTGPQTCVQARATPLPARLVALSASAQVSNAPETMTVEAVFDAFTNACGSCHGATSGMGSFQIATASSFKTQMTPPSAGDAILAHATSNEVVGPQTPLNPNDPIEPMPPYGSAQYSPYSKRPATDSVVQFVTLAQEWLAAGATNTFVIGQGDGGLADGGSSEQSYAMTPAMGDAMTNLGDCIPSKGLVGIETTVSAQLDTMFASLQPSASGSASQMAGLPEHLSQTDLTTFDTRVLAEHGVVAYAPTYPLWSDDAGKLRFVRVPRGTSIKFDKATQQFTIPANTRFYKTFMKQIIDTDSSIRWRKIETRLIVSRPDTPGVEGDGAHNALFGTYRWNDQETDATLVTTGLRDGTLWGDTVLQYNTNEPFVADLLKGDPNTSEETLLEDQAARNYAIPSKERCIQCHEGSASQSFVLGFLPVQVSRRRTGEGGTYEPAGPDELTQLQRLIDYGVVTGIDLPGDVLPLEELEGSRKPRNDYELQAQAYTLGNCAHCHNPRGYPSVENPVLKTVFNLLPGPDGGLFQFPLERYSPRIFRGNGGTTQMPYITPSLMDYPRFDPLNNSKLVSSFVVLTASTSPPAAAVLYAPWRSLMYRNVDTAFSYVDDEALFPHMPRNTAGYDNRAPRILSDWMVSIPAVLKDPERTEYAFIDTWDGQPATFQEPDTDEQPYVEVFPGDPRYDSAVAAASARLAILHTGVNPQLDVPRDDQGNPTEALTPRYQQDRNTGDIIDPATLADPICSPVPTGRLCGPGSSSTVCDPPDHPNWTRLDETNPEVYATRRVDWVEKLAEQQPDNVSGCGGASAPANVSAHQDEEDAVSLLQTVSLAPFRSYATTKVAYGFWQVQPGCDYSGEKTAASLMSTSSGDTRWLNNPATHTPPSAPVYYQTPGAAVFKSICINCHGARADGSGRLADNLAEMTGGQARPADFRDGLFGPVGAAPDANHRHAVFGSGVPATTPDWYSLDGTPLDDDDRASRYMAWMALGGTQVLIPPPILQIVSLTRVLGTRRPYFAAAQPSANMLSTAKLLCETLLGNSKTPEPTFDPKGIYSEYIDGNPEFIGTNHDGKTWFDMCRQGHPSPVHVMHLSSCPSHLCEPSAFINGALSVSRSLIDPGSYPSGTPVGDPDSASGSESSLTPENPFPWCVEPLDYLSGQQALDYISQQGWPLCPQNVTYWTTADASRWATRGAINAGLAVFLYLDGLEKKSAPDPDFDECPSTGTAGDP